MHIYALVALAFVMAVLCLAFVIRVQPFANKAIRFLALAVRKAIDGEYAALAAGFQEESAIAKFADIKAMTVAQSSASFPFPLKAGWRSEASLATNDVNCFSVTNEMTDLGSIDWNSINASCLHSAT